MANPEGEPVRARAIDRRAAQGTVMKQGAVANIGGQWHAGDRRDRPADLILDLSSAFGDVDALMHVTREAHNAKSDTSGELCRCFRLVYRHFGQRGAARARVQRGHAAN